MRRATLLASLVLIGGACSSSESAPTLATGTTARPTTTAVATATSSAVTSPVSTSTAGGSTTAPTDPAVPLPQTAEEDDFEVIWRELIAYHNWAFQNPEIADPAVYIAEECECFANAIAILEEYRANGWRETSEGLIVHEVDVDLATSTFALMTVIDEHSPLVVVDAAGQVVRERDRRPKTFWDVRVRQFDAGWRIVEWFQRGGVGDAE